MQIRLVWILGLITLLVVGGCSVFEGDEDEDVLFCGSNPLIKSLYIGDVPVREGDTVNVALSNVSSIRFILDMPVSEASLATSLDFSIVIENVDKGLSTILNKNILSENGQFVWLDDSNTRIEFRMTHPMSYVMVGGTPLSLGGPGDRFKVHVRFLTVKSQSGHPYSYVDDEFYVVWTKSTSIGSE